MMHGLGLTLIVLSGAYFGILPVCRMQRQLLLLSAWEDCLRSMAADLHSGGLPVRALLEQAGKRHDLLRPVFREMCSELDRLGITAFSEVWASCVAEQSQMLPREALSLVSFPGDVLGKYTPEDQLAVLYRSADGLHELYGELHGTLKTTARVYLSCGLAAGMITGIALL